MEACLHLKGRRELRSDHKEAIALYQLKPAEKEKLLDFVKGQGSSEAKTQKIKTDILI
jgi:hypothetical protein